MKEYNGGGRKTTKERSSFQIKTQSNYSNTYGYRCIQKGKGGEKGKGGR